MGGEGRYRNRNNKQTNKLNFVLYLNFKSSPFLNFKKMLPLFKTEPHTSPVILSVVAAILRLCQWNATCRARNGNTIHKFISNFSPGWLLYLPRRMRLLFTNNLRPCLHHLPPSKDHSKTPRASWQSFASQSLFRKKNAVQGSVSSYWHSLQ